MKVVDASPVCRKQIHLVLRNSLNCYFMLCLCFATPNIKGLLKFQVFLWWCIFSQTNRRTTESSKHLLYKTVSGGQAISGVLDRTFDVFCDWSTHLHKFMRIPDNFVAHLFFIEIIHFFGSTTKPHVSIVQPLILYVAERYARARTWFLNIFELAHTPPQKTHWITISFNLKKTKAHNNIAAQFNRFL